MGLRRGALAPATVLVAALAASETKPVRAETIWIEGEKPVRSTMNRHPWWYDQVKRDQFSGGDFIGLLGADLAMPVLAEWDVRV